MEEEENENETKVVPYANVIIKLLRGVVYLDDKKIWDMLESNLVSIKDYVGKIGLEVVKTSEYCYLKQCDLDENPNLLRLVKRTTLTYRASLICVFLRQYLQDFDKWDNNSTYCIIRLDKLKELLSDFYKKSPNKLKNLKDIEKGVTELVKVQFLREIDEDGVLPHKKKYEVKRIIESKISYEELESFKEKMEEKENVV